MYNQHFGLEKAPFKITPDTGMFYTGAGRAEVLEALVYAIVSGEGIIKVVGEVGTGKTMLCRMLELKLPANVDIVYLANPSLSPEDILHAIALDMSLDVGIGANRIQVLHRIQQHLLDMYARNRHVVVLVEEAQSMPTSTLEEIRLLSNLETKQDKLLQIVLFGQPELDLKLADSGIRQLRDRITHSFYLDPFDPSEIRDYVDFRLRGAGYRGRNAFSKGAYEVMSRASEGLTRRVNILADKALLAAFAEDTHDVTRKHVRIAANDSRFRRRGRWGWPELAVGGGLACIAIAMVWAVLETWSPGDTVAAGDELASAPALAPPVDSTFVSDVRTENRPVPVPVPVLASKVTDPPAPQAQAGIAGAQLAETRAERAVVVAPEPVAEIVPETIAESPRPLVQATTSPDSAVAPTPPLSQASSEQAAISSSFIAASQAAPTPAPAPAPGVPAARPEPAPEPVAEMRPPMLAAALVPSPALSAAPQVAAAQVDRPAAASRVVASGAAAGATERRRTSSLVDSRMLATRDWLERADGSHYSIQLLVTDVSRRANLEDFLRSREREGNLDGVYVYRTDLNGESRYGVLYQDYPTFGAARDALESLPPELARHRPFIRNVRDIEILG